MPHRHPQGHPFAPLPGRLRAACRRGLAGVQCDSGGTAVPHGAGILNLSPACCPAPPRIWAHYYRLLGAPARPVEEHGLAGSYDFVPGLFATASTTW